MCSTRLPPSPLTCSPKRTSLSSSRQSRCDFEPPPPASDASDAAWLGGPGPRYGPWLGSGDLPRLLCTDAACATPLVQLGRLRSN
jgi:hypothetical protein